ncbi:hypothetical protein OEZ85_005392 [Tetradesmus obliquus]|uniref:Peptidase M43 pregnancy-associated plasma-A domain-containing protein n=1 Tax=Tetradesmus obliquus TaxID=3088 RepID=A0ABY8UIJ3_TETOB|nr:hypothetical protein OEZ85_005392 [Tetradesmus obliquus]
MQACQAADTGVPAESYTFAVHWTAAQVCSGSSGCIGGDYTTETVHEQIAFMNKLFAHAGVAFTWDGVIHNATAGSYDEVDEDGWICALPRYGDGMTFHVITSPRHLFGGGVLGYTNYLSSFSKQYGGFPQCLNRVHIFEKTLPGLGGRSVVDGGLSDSGAVLAHEVGHQLMLHHTWFEATWERQEAAAQCHGSASMDPTDIAAFRSDGVRDTTAQSLNYTGQIIRFVGCHPATGLYTNSSINAQQSCTSAVGFPAGDAYYNNYNNLMSYGDKTCLRTITAGQAARARCAVKCMVLGQC